MSLKRKILVGLVVFSAVVITFAYAQVDLAMQTIQFELSRIGKSVLEARNKDGKWPANIEDLEGTEYFKMPYRKEMLEKGLFVVVTQRDDPTPEGDRSRVLAYDNGSLLCRFGRIGVCRGDLRIEYLNARDLNELLKAKAT